jgi:acyl carrier protein
MTKEELCTKLKVQIVDYLNLIDVEPTTIKEDVPFFGPDSELSLDSIDSIELTVLLEREYGIKITDPKEGRKALKDISTMADYILEHEKA